MIPDLCPSPSGISVSSLSDSLFVLHVQREDNKQKVTFEDLGGRVLYLWTGLTPSLPLTLRGT